MRYPQGGGLPAERQQFREELRLQVAERFARGEASSVIAKDLRVSVRSVQRWRQVWEEGGPRALRSQGPTSLPRLSEKQFAQLETEPAKGPAAHGWEDQRWTPARIKTVIGRRFHLTYTIQGVRKLLVRNGWSCRVPPRSRPVPRPTAQAVAATAQHHPRQDPLSRRAGHDHSQRPAPAAETPLQHQPHRTNRITDTVKTALVLHHASARG